MYKTIKASILFPSLTFFLLMALVIVMWWKQAAKKRWLIALTIITILFYASSTRIITRLYIGSLEWSYPRQESTPDHADVIVVLGGGFRYHGPDNIGPDNIPSFTLMESSMHRTVHAAKVYHHVGGCPIIVSGGNRNNKGPQATQHGIDLLNANPMSRLLLQLGVDQKDIILEEESRDTYENIYYSKKLIEEKAYKDIVLVTDAAHMNRSQLCCEKLGLTVTPAASTYYAQSLEFSPYTLLPSDEGIRQARYATQEYLGLLWYWLRGRI